MFTRWNSGWREFDDMIAAMNQLRQQVESGFDGTQDGGGGSERPAWSVTMWPRTNLTDGGNTLVLTAEVPGLGQKDIQLTLNQDVLSIRGERRVEAPAGYSAHRQERRPVKFARSFSLPCRVNPERVMAAVKDGILTVTFEKAAEAMPRQIQIGNG